MYVIDIHYFIYTFSNFMYSLKKHNYTFLNCQLTEWIARMYTIWVSFNIYEMCVLDARIKVDF